MEDKMNSLKKTARGAGVLYITMDVFMIFGGMYVVSKLYVPGDTVATVSNILASEWLLRLGFVSLLVGYILQLYLVHVLYELFQSVDKGQARVMVILVVAGVSVAFLNTLNQYAPILLFSGAAHLSAFNPAQLQTLAMVFFDMYKHGEMIDEIFWGLWLIPLGILVYRSGFVPKVLGVLLIVGCFGHLISFLSTFLFPGYSTILTPIGDTVMIGELPIFFWLLIRGVKDQQPSTRTAS
ncbi:MAG: DUF4386 domain-containing protein [Desulfobacterales bacterium]|nr:DUF4386 domain-containing protein [Desulfobacterales bacterium]